MRSMRMKQECCEFVHCPRCGKRVSLMDFGARLNILCPRCGNKTNLIVQVNGNIIAESVAPKAV